MPQSGFGDGNRGWRGHSGSYVSQEIHPLGEPVFNPNGAIQASPGQRPIGANIRTKVAIGGPEGRRKLAGGGTLLIRLLDNGRLGEGSDNSPALQCWVKGWKNG